MIVSLLRARDIVTRKIVELFVHEGFV